MGACGELRFADLVPRLHAGDLVAAQAADDDKAWRLRRVPLGFAAGVRAVASQAGLELGLGVARRAVGIGDLDRGTLVRQQVGAIEAAPRPALRSVATSTSTTAGDRTRALTA